MRLLLCDDHSVFAESLALVLGEAGYDIVAVTRSPDEALAALRDTPAEVFVLDAGDPPAGVLGRLAEVREATPGAEIVLLCAYVDPEVVAAATTLGVRGFAFKDQHVADIIDTIERVHRGETVAPALPHPQAVPEARDARRFAAQLTPREREVLCRLVHGEDTNGVARTMGVTWATARSHIQSVLTKLGVHSRVEAAAAAVRHGLVSAETGEWLPD